MQLVRTRITSLYLLLTLSVAQVLAQPAQQSIQKTNDHLQEGAPLLAWQTINAVAGNNQTVDPGILEKAIDLAVMCGYYKKAADYTGQLAKLANSQVDQALTKYYKALTHTLLEEYGLAAQYWPPALENANFLSPQKRREIDLEYSRFLIQTENYETAEEILDRLMSKLKDWKNQPIYFKALICKSELDLKTDRLQAAKTALDQVITDLEDKPEDRLLLAEAQNWRGLSLYYFGQYHAAREDLEFGKTIWEETGLSHHGKHAQLLENLGLVLSEGLNLLDVAEELFNRALKINKAIWKDGLQEGEVLGNLASLYNQLGLRDRTEQLAEKSIRILAQKGVIRSYSTALNNLSVIHIDQYYNYERDFLDQAIDSLQKALSLYEAKYGKRTLRYTSFLTNLAEIEYYNGEEESAMDVHRQAMAITKGILGTQNRFYIGHLYGLGAIYEESENYDSAEVTFKKVLQLKKNIYGEDHPNYLEELYNLAQFYQIDRPDLAFEWYQLANQKQIELVRTYYAAFDEQTRLSYLTSLKDNLTHFYNFAHNHPDLPGIGAALQDIRIATKGLALEYSIANRLKIFSSDKPEDKALYQRLDRARRELTRAYFSPGTIRRDNKPGLDQLKLVVTELEKAVVRQLKANETSSHEWQYTSAELQKELPENAAMIEFLVYTVPDEEKIDVKHLTLAALLTKSDQPTRFIPICRLDTVRQIMSRVGKPFEEYSYVMNLRESFALYQLVWEPLAESVQGVERIYLIPDGALNLLAFEALPTNSEGTQTLMDLHRFSRYNNVRDFFNEGPPLPLPKSAALFGGAKFDAKPAPEPNTEDLAFSPPDYTNYALASRNFGVRFNDLRATGQEVDTIGTILKSAETEVDVYLGVDASEAGLRGISGQAPELLHLATHGFVHDSTDVGRAETGETVLRNIVRSAEESLLRSGLVLTGVNYAWEKGEIINPANDGILSSIEISNLDLTDASIAILSACDTGNGDFRYAEGVFGLQRAFKTAGVEKLILSLWQVEDEATREFMTLFYRQWGDRPNPELALLEAQKIMRNRYPDAPEIWAAFVLVN